MTEMRSLGLFDSDVGKVLGNAAAVLVIGLDFLGQMADELCLGHA